MNFDAISSYGSGLLGGYWPVVWTVTKIVALVVPLLLCVAYLTLWERKAIGWSQIRPGPNRVGPLGLLQPIADAVKLIFKEIIVPTAANRGLFFLGPIMTIMPALAAWPSSPERASIVSGPNIGPSGAVSACAAAMRITLAASDASTRAGRTTRAPPWLTRTGVPSTMPRSAASSLGTPTAGGRASAVRCSAGARRTIGSTA